MNALVKSFIDCESGATAMEYGLLLALIGAAVVAAMGTFNNSLTTAFTSIGTQLNTQTSQAWGN